MRSLIPLLIMPIAVVAQTSLPTEFPTDSVTLAPEVLTQRLVGKVFKVKPADGTTWRLEYKDSGYAFLDTSRGYRDTGKWRVEGTQLCADWQRSPSGCSETRAKGDVIYLKRISNGEVVALFVE